VQGKYQGELPQKAREARAIMANIDQKHKLVAQDIDHVMTLINQAQIPATGFWGDWLKNTGDTTASDVNLLLDTIRTHVGLDELQSLKASGSTLGQVTEAEHRLLQAALGNLNQRQSKEQFLRSLERLKTTLAERKQLRERAYQEQFAGTQGQGQQAPVLGTPDNPITPAHIQQLMERYGGTEAEWRAKIDASKKVVQ
jgi:predicted NBD/HSP70 family sugar kinase